jgi:hypothetical protein
VIPECCQFSLDVAFLCSLMRVLMDHDVWPMYVDVGAQGQSILYTPFFCSLGAMVLFLEHRMLANFVPDLKCVLHPALSKVLLSWLESPRIKGMQANGHRCCVSMSAVVSCWDAVVSSCCISWSCTGSLKGKKSKRLVCMASCWGWPVDGEEEASNTMDWDLEPAGGGLYVAAMVESFCLSCPLKHVESEVYFPLNLNGRTADAVGTAEFTFVYGVDDFRVLARVGFGDYVSVGWLAVYACGDAAIGKACDVDIKESNGAIYFLLPGKPDPGVNGI